MWPRPRSKCWHHRYPFQRQSRHSFAVFPCCFPAEKTDCWKAEAFIRRCMTWQSLSGKTIVGSPCDGRAAFWWWGLSEELRTNSSVSKLLRMWRVRMSYCSVLRSCMCTCIHKIEECDRSWYNITCCHVDMLLATGWWFPPNLWWRWFGIWLHTPLAALMFGIWRLRPFWR